MRCTSSRFFTAPPRPSAASSSSAARRWSIDFSLRFRAASRSQRIASAIAAHRAHFDRHLVVGAADAAALHLDHRLDVGDRLPKTSIGSLPDLS